MISSVCVAVLIIVCIQITRIRLHFTAKNPPSHFGTAGDRSSHHLEKGNQFATPFFARDRKSVSNAQHEKARARAGWVFNLNILAFIYEIPRGSVLFVESTNACSKRPGYTCCARDGYLLKSNLNHFEVRVRCYDLWPQRSQDGIERKRSYWWSSQLMGDTDNIGLRNNIFVLHIINKEWLYINSSVIFLLLKQTIVWFISTTPRWSNLEGRNWSEFNERRA